MSALDAIKLLILSAIWGASFLFLRVAAPDFGPVPLIFFRVSVAALLLSPVLLQPGNRRTLWEKRGPLAILGLCNSTLPFCLLAYATLSLEAGLTSLLNASTPFFAALVGFAWLGISLDRIQIAGLALGIAGVGILAADRLDFRPGGSGWAVAAVLAATFSYGVATHYSKTRFRGDSPLLVSAGSLAFSTVFLLPFALVLWPETAPGAMAWACAGALAILCTAVAFVLFFDILDRSGATAATTVTFVIPIFGVLWGSSILGETLTPRMVAGMIVALLGTAFTLGLFPKRA